MASYWTWKRKSKAIVQRQLEAINTHEEELVGDGEGFEEMELAGADMEVELEGADMAADEYSESDSPSDSDDGDLGEALAAWAVSENIPHSALGKLLKILQSHHASLPADPRTLLKTKRSEAMDVKNKAGGTYYHFGILPSMTATLEAHQSALSEGMCLELQVNVDGLPLFKSSSMQFWPILSYIQNLPTHSPFVITLFSGNGRPALHEYMEDFIQDVNNMEKGFKFNGMNLRLKLQAMVCDAPAGAFLKCVKGHTGYSGCEKCTQEGEYLNHRIVFPETNASLRQDEDFIDMSDEGHHLGSSPLLATSLGLVSGFPLDFMHLVCLGVMRHLHLWLKGPLACRLSSRQVDSLSEDLESTRAWTPAEFNRRPRTLREIDRWKASEFRQLLLYTGPVLFQSVLHSSIYQHFLLLFVGILILSNDKLLAVHFDCANSALLLFVQHFREVYGDTYMSYNVHNLVHLANDVKLHGNLNSFSAFKFENFMKTLKKMVRKTQSPCSQVVKRILERGSWPNPVPKVVDLGLKGEHLNGPLPPMCSDAIQYSVYKSKDFSLKLDKANCYTSIDGKVAKIRNVITTQEDIYVVYSTFKKQESFFSYPVPSKSLGIFLLDRLSENTRLCSVAQIQHKLFMLPQGHQFVAMPLVHAT